MDTNPIDNKEYAGFKIGELRTAFTQIQDKRNWKLPIIAKVPKADFPKFYAAAVFFAGSTLEIVPQTEVDGMVEVYGAGYYNCVGA